MPKIRIPLSELRPWLWLPAAALLFVAVAWSINIFGVRGWLNPPVVTACAVLGASIVGSAATYWARRGPREQRRGLSRWGAVGVFSLLTVLPHLLVGLCLTIVAGISGGLGAAATVEAALYLPLILLVVVGWAGIPIGGVAGLLAWSLGARRIRHVRSSSEVLDVL